MKNFCRRFRDCRDRAASLALAPMSTAEIKRLMLALLPGLSRQRIATLLAVAMPLLAHAETQRPLPPLSRATKPALDSPDEFTFAVMGDCRATLPGVALPRHFHDLVRDVALLRPACVLFAGDAIHGYGLARQQLLNEYDRFRAAVAPSGIPWFNAPGNHEMQSEPSAVEALKAAGQALYGSFDSGRARSGAASCASGCRRSGSCSRAGRCSRRS